MRLEFVLKVELGGRGDFCFGLLALHRYLDMAGDFAVQLHRNMVLAEALQGSSREILRRSIV